MVGAMLRHRAVREAARRGREALAFVGLERRADEPAGRLTVAEQKRLEVARALATEPKLLLLDEVMAGLNRLGGAGGRRPRPAHPRPRHRLPRRRARDGGASCPSPTGSSCSTRGAQDRRGTARRDRPRPGGAWPPTSGRPTMLRVHDLRVSYGRVPALHGLCSRSRPDRSSAVVGANGDGKSTTAPRHRRPLPRRRRVDRARRQADPDAGGASARRPRAVAHPRGPAAVPAPHRAAQPRARRLHAARCVGDRRVAGAGPGDCSRS